MLEGSQASPNCLSQQSGIELQMSTEHWYNDTDRKYAEKHLP